MGAYAPASTKSGPACRFDQLSSARASVVHRRNEVGFLSARAIIAKPLVRKPYTRDPTSSRQARMLPYCVAASASRAQATPLVRRQNLISKSHSRALPRRFNSRSPVQPTVFWTALVRHIMMATPLSAHRTPALKTGETPVPLFDRSALNFGQSPCAVCL